MRKIKDSHTLGISAGFIGGIGMIILDQISYKFGISKRSYAQAASGMWVASKRQARSKGGNILGVGMTLGLSSLGGVVMTRLLSKKGIDNLITKGVFYGATSGALITALLSAFPGNKVRPKDATSNLSYVGANILYGLITTQLISRLGNRNVLSKSLMNPIRNTNVFIPEEQLKEEKIYYQH